MTATTQTFTDANGWKVYVELSGSMLNITLGKQILKACKTIEDVQRCAGMGDFRIQGYDIPTA